MPKGHPLYDDNNFVRNIALSDYDLITRVSGVDTKIAKGTKWEVLQMSALGDTFGWAPIKKAIIIACLTKDETHAIATNIAPISFVVPFGGVFDTPYAEIETAGTTGVVTIDINKNGTTIFVTRITIDSGELTSRDAATVPVIVGADTFAKYDKFTVDIDGIHTTPGKGLTIYLPIEITDFSSVLS